MCGIVGIGSKSLLIEQDMLTSMRDTMHHRGPDDAGIWLSGDDHVGLAHRRLAIIDLSTAGHQPMEDMSGKLCIIFNGEIYNYQDLRRELETRGHQFRSAATPRPFLKLIGLGGRIVFRSADSLSRPPDHRIRLWARSRLTPSIENRAKDFVSSLG